MFACAVLSLLAMIQHSICNLSRAHVRFRALGASANLRGLTGMRLRPSMPCPIRLVDLEHRLAVWRDVANPLTAERFDGCGRDADYRSEKKDVRADHEAFRVGLNIGETYCVSDFSVRDACGAFHGPA